MHAKSAAVLSNYAGQLSSICKIQPSRLPQSCNTFISTHDHDHHGNGTVGWRVSHQELKLSCTVIAHWPKLVTMLHLTIKEWAL